VAARARSHSTRFYGKEATARLPEPVPEAERLQPVPVLKVITRRRPRWGVVLVVLAFALVAVGSSVVAPVLVNAATTEVESAVSQVEAQQEALTGDVSTLSAAISSLSSPQRVAEQATQLGLVPAEDVHYVAAQPAPSALAAEEDTTVAGR
jgi:cell division protein FtsL